MLISRAFLCGLCVLGAEILRADLAALAVLDGASAYEGPVLAYIRSRLGGRQEVDNTGSLSVTFGSGPPHTLLIAGLDEPGYVVSAITADGYLRVHRLSAAPPHHNFEKLFLAQPIRVTTGAGHLLNGVVAAPSVHLQSERGSSLRVDHPEEFYIDIGARTAAEARQAGADILDPVTLEKYLTDFGPSGRISAPWISSRAGAAILLEIGRRLAKSPAPGTVTLAFASQQYSGNRGLARLARRVDARRVVWIRPGGNPQPSVAPASDSQPAAAQELLALARKQNLDLDRETAARVTVPAFAGDDIWKDPARVAVLTLGVENAGTPAEVLSRPTLDRLANLLARFAAIPGGPVALPPAAAPPEPPFPASTLETLIALYGVSTREAPVRDAIRALLPDWARRASHVDQKGNLIVGFGSPPERLFLSHMDELGFEVTEVEPDGKLRAESRGGGTSEFFEWRAALLFAASRSWPALVLGGGFGSRSFRIDVGPAQGVQTGDTAALRKQFRPLLGRRLNARSADDRIGCAVLVDVLRSLEPGQIRRPTWFAFTVEEEIGLRGAEFLTQSARPREVYALDTFVSSDSPLESPRLAGARLGDGFVVRAIDSSGITPRAAVQRVAALARSNAIPVQYGVTSGANDGSKFVTGGAVNIPLGWPLRYSHSPAETVDLDDVDALAKIVRLLVIE